MISLEVGKKKKEDSYKNNDFKFRLGNFRIIDKVSWLFLYYLSERRIGKVYIFCVNTVSE